MTDDNEMSLNFLGGGVSGQILVDCQTLRFGELLEEVSKLVFSGEMEVC